MSFKAICLYAVTVTCLVIPSSGFAWGDLEIINIGTRDVPYRVTDGTNTQTGFVKYHAFVTRRIVEEGDPSTMWHPVDDRKCKWNIEAHLDREVCLNSLAGGQSCNNSLRKELPFKIDASNGALTGIFDHRPCTDSVHDIDGDTSSIVRAADINQVSNNDLNGDLAETMRGKGVTITYNQ